MAIEVDPAAEALGAELDRLGDTNPVGSREDLWCRVGAALLVLGPIWVAGAYVVSHSTRNSLQQRDAFVAALFGVALAVVGAALFLRYSVGRVLRLWMARSTVAQAQHLAALREAVVASRAEPGVHN